jgi:hypothetical protein
MFSLQGPHQCGRTFLCAVKIIRKSLPRGSPSPLLELLRSYYLLSQLPSST